MRNTRPDPVRRETLRAVAAAPFALSAAASALFATARRDDTLTVGVIGCGGRGTGAALNALEAGSDVRIVALGDAFADRLEGCRRGLAEAGGDRGTVAEAKCFVGLDAYRGVCGSDCDVVILATPPGFRPIHFAEAIRTGKHVFLEKPVAVDAPGVRTVIEAAKAAKDRNLCVVAGTQRRHQKSYLDAMERIHRGDIGAPVAARCYWNQGGLWNVDPQDGRSEVENQMRNWLYHSWLSGDHIVEQHVHQLDVMNWGFRSHPKLVRGVGGRQARTDGRRFGHIYDHFGLEYVYPGPEGFGDAFVLSMCRQQDGTPNRVEEVFTGTQGIARLAPGSARFSGPKAWQFGGPDPNPYVEEHRNLQRAIRTGSGLNEGVQVAESTLTAIMGRMAAYTGQDVTWEQAMASEERLMPERLEFGPRPVAPVAVPGRTKIS
jgi:predicted dehydrogenase